ncbi:DNA polymerase III, epsilon subunit [Faunimonas pinastri]|uniref:DNA polymerase III subunit epsilon n=1 Tax=Faunimonas pinastri TaxID=1855383 RepID=A0A1H9GX56_9HYPH|nr:DNA polymerase III subunit epsilon [Faunimonas pinastri]SEQ54600.1 DNA polymerase III, epsilon subunit [Faunimonas pinastri]
MREIVFDTETTGLDCLNGDRLIEIGCVEILNRIPTGRTHHIYINPKRTVHPEAVQVHGITDEFLSDKPCFEHIVDEFMEFVGDSPLVAHNSSFDRGFINMELKLCGRLIIEDHRFVDTLMLARRRHPNGPNSLDALCSRYGIDNSNRTKHGALLDAMILSEVYIELLGGRQATFELGSAGHSSASRREARMVRQRPKPLAPRLTPEELAAHGAFLAGMGGTPLWARYNEEAAAEAAA